MTRRARQLWLATFSSGGLRTSAIPISAKAWVAPPSICEITRPAGMTIPRISFQASFKSRDCRPDCRGELRNALAGSGEVAKIRPGIIVSSGRFFGNWGLPFEIVGRSPVSRNWHHGRIDAHQSDCGDGCTKTSLALAWNVGRSRMLGSIRRHRVLRKPSFVGFANRSRIVLPAAAKLIDASGYRRITRGAHAFARDELRRAK